MQASDRMDELMAAGYTFEAAWDRTFGMGDYARLEAEGQTWAALVAEVGVVEADRLMGVEA